MENTRKTLPQLALPIGLEILFFMLAGMVDTMMLSSVSNQAVGAVGTANTYISIFIMMFSIISTGMIAVMTQNIGAQKPGVAWQARQLGIGFNMVIGVAMSIFLYRFAGTILGMVGVAQALFEPAETYLKIVGGSCLLNALIPVFSSYLRAFGHTKESLIASVTGNIVNFVLNAYFLFVLHQGVRGVACATVLSRILNLFMVMWMGHRLIHAKSDPHRLPVKTVLGQIIKVGFPSAMETMLYNLSMTLVIRFLNQMDSEGLNVTARSYAIQICNFSYCAGAALAHANAILSGWHIGAGDYEACKKSTKKAAVQGIIISVVLAGLMAFAGRWIMRLFTDDANMIQLVVKLLVIDIFLEIGRVTNLVYGQALKTSGDAVYPVIIGIVFMYLCAVTGTYVMGIQMGLMAVGSYAAMALDEIVRAFFMVRRFNQGKWQKKRLVV